MLVASPLHLRAPWAWLIVVFRSPRVEAEGHAHTDVLGLQVSIYGKHKAPLRYTKSFMIIQPRLCAHRSSKVLGA